MKFNSRSGFSLVEVLVVLTISTFILASSYATIISLAKGSESMINFSEMNNQTRYALEIFGRDARMADKVNTFDSSRFVMRRLVWDNANDSHQPLFVAYEHIPSAGTFTRTLHKVENKKGVDVPGDIISSEVLLFDVDDLDFYYYRLLDSGSTSTDNIAKTLLEVKHVQLEAKMQRSVLNLKNTNYIISARFMMRNRDVSE